MSNTADYEEEIARLKIGMDVLSQQRNRALNENVELHVVNSQLAAQSAATEKRAAAVEESLDRACERASCKTT